MEVWDETTPVGQDIRKIIFTGTPVSVTRVGDGVAVVTVTSTGGGGGGGSSSIAVATDALTGTAVGSDVTLNLASLANTPLTVLAISREGQVLTPVSDWSVSGGVVTVTNADATDTFLVTYTYVLVSTDMKTDSLTGSASGSDVTLALSGLSHTYDTVLWVTRNGQLLQPVTGYGQSGATITVYNADETDVFLVTYTFDRTATTTTAEALGATASGSDITLNLNSLAHTFDTILWVSRNGQLVTPTTGWLRSENTITVYNADASDEYLVSYTYA